ncbi:MAG: PQQ-binding-like beta-propeller repeat protein, partial [Streptosporangiales bacterium]
MEPLAAGDPSQVGGYRLRARLGAGGMGQVFLGYSPAGRAVAVKIIHRELASDPMFRARFRREAAAARAVSGAYTAPVVAAGPDDDPPWLATLFVPGPSLAEAVDTAGPLPAVSVWKLAAGLVEALQAIHSCGLVHRDLKPANVLLALDGPRVIDFGIARALEKTAMTSTGMIVGTPSFMSPEQAEGSRVGPPTDVFSLGCVIVFAATGTGPFGNGAQASMLYRIVHTAPALDEVPGGLRELAAACLAKAPADRPGLAALVDATAAGRPADDGDMLTSFWPVAVTGLIRSHQRRLAIEKPDRADTSPGTAETAQAGSGGPRATRLNIAAVPEAAPAASPTTAPGGAAGEQATQRPTVLATTPAHRGEPAVPVNPPIPTGPALPAALTMPAAPAMPADSIAARPPGVTRRRALAGLAVLAGAGLAGAGWELSQGTSAPHPARPGHAPRSTPTPRSTGARLAAGELWSFPTGGMVAGIALDRSTVFAGSTDGRVYALRAGDGTRLWAFPTGGPVQSSIAAARGRVYAGSGDQKVYALRAGDGTRLWAFPTGGSVDSAIAVAGGAVYAGSEDEMMYALRASDGTRLWSVPVPGVVGIAVAGGSVYACGADGEVHALRASDGTTLWASPAGTGGVAGIAAAGAVVYAGSGDGRVYALRAGNGTRLWDFRANGSVQSGIAAGGGMVYAGSNGDMMYGLRARDGSRLWGFPTRGSVTSITLADEVVYVGGNDYTVRALRAADGTQLWSFTAEGPVESQIAVAGGIA